MFINLGYRKNKKKSTVRERPIRSIVKAITWRIIGTADTVVLSYFITGKMIMAFTIGSVEVFSKMFLYFLHERAWAIVRWGRMLVILRQNTRWTKSIVKRIILR